MTVTNLQYSYEVLQDRVDSLLKQLISLENVSGDTGLDFGAIEVQNKIDSIQHAQKLLISDHVHRAKIQAHNARTITQH